jgi:hypothetical protein
MSPFTFLPLFRSAALPPNEKGGGLAFDLAKNGKIPPGKREAFQILTARLVPSELTVALTDGRGVFSTKVRASEMSLSVQCLVLNLFSGFQGSTFDRCLGSVASLYEF